LASRLSSSERIALFEDIVGYNPTRAQADKILRAVERGERGKDPARLANRETLLREVLTEMGITENEIALLIPALFRSGSMGHAPASMMVLPIRGSDFHTEAILAADLRVKERVALNQAANFQQRLW
jgi:hypothetical protein